MEHKEYKVKVHLWKDKTKEVDYGIKVININELQCINCSSYICKRTLNQKITCNLWMNEYFEIIKKEKTNGNNRNNREVKRKEI